MNILISQSQGETFAALSLQLPLPNTRAHTHVHTQNWTSSLRFLQAAAPACFIPLVAHSFVRAYVCTEEDNVHVLLKVRGEWSEHG